MASAHQPEVWLSGPLPDIIPALQPVAHALLQAREELEACMQHFPAHLLWERPAGVAATGFHLKHISGVLDRLFTYARGEMLNEKQLQYLASEADPSTGESHIQELVQGFHAQVEAALQQLKRTREAALYEPRGVGRAQLPSTVIGLLTHAAEHTMRHIGQLLVTVRIITRQ